jgi:nucleotide-binding universal stress UspA family protein
MSIRRILVPTDFSPHADGALQHAAALAQRLSANLHLLHAYDVGFAVAFPEQVVLPPEFIDSVRTSALAQLDRVAIGLSDRGIVSQTHASPLPAVGAILDLAESLPADLIAIGTRGLSGIKHVLLGSVAERTMRLAPCPVLTVRADVPTAPPSGTIVVPVDLSPASHHAVRYARELGSALGKPTIVLVHAFHLPPEIEAYALQHGQPLLESLSEAAAAELESIVSELQDAGIACEYVARPGRPEQVVSDLVDERRADAVVMLTHGRGGLAHAALGSVAERVTRKANCPVITLKAPPESPA